MANKFFETWVFNFNGLLIGGVTWGLLHFITKESKSIFFSISNILHINSDIEIELFNESKKIYNWKIIYPIGILLGTPGMYTLWKCVYPLNGFSQIYLFLGSGSLHLTASILLVHIYFVIKFFRFIEKKSNNFLIKDNISFLNLKTFNIYFVLTATIGLLATYLAFRGTITAGFQFPHLIYKKLLFYPLIVYLPMALFYSFYPRYILKKINDQSISLELDKLDELQSKVYENNKYGLKESLEMRAIIVEIKSKIQLEMKQIPLLSLKDYPSIIIVFIMLLQFILQEDKTISDFLKSINI